MTTRQPRGARREPKRDPAAEPAQDPAAEPAQDPAAAAAPPTAAAASPAPKPARKPAAKRVRRLTPASAPDSFPVVGIGASAGGLAAIEEFLAALPADGYLGMAFVLIQHLDPDHKSLLLDLVRQYTSMPVAWATDDDQVLPGHFYVMPPNKDVAIMGGRLRLMNPEAPRGRRLPIDGFFRSLAQDRGDRAVCIVLSGTGSDGVIGLRAVKGEGGMVMAQQPDTAGYDGMPRNAIATGDVDFVLPPKEMPAQLLAYASRAYVAAPPQEVAPSDEEWLSRILVLLRDRYLGVGGQDVDHGDGGRR